MRTERYFHITTLPLLGELGSAPSMGLADLVEHVSEDASWRKLVSAVILLDDLEQREAFLAGELDEVEPSVLTLQQVRDQAPLPDCLAGTEEEEHDNAIGADLLWGHYFRHAAAVARAERNSFLRRWVAFEVGLRNALATARAKRLGLNELSYVVAAELAGVNEDENDWSVVLAPWESATTPLAGQRAVIRARWDWVHRHEAWFSFSADELLVYAVRVMLLEQWQRLMDRDEAAASPAER
jgi:hypothetical protein